MSKRYSIWDKKSSVLCPSGAIFTAEQWMDQYPIAKIPESVIIGGPNKTLGLFDGSFFGEIHQVVANYSSMGCDFSDCKTPEEILDRVDEFETKMFEESKLLEAQRGPTTQERIADALERIANALEKSK